MVWLHRTSVNNVYKQVKVWKVQVYALFLMMKKKQNLLKIFSERRRAVFFFPREIPKWESWKILKSKSETFPKSQFMLTQRIIHVHIWNICVTVAFIPANLTFILWLPPTRIKTWSQVRSSVLILRIDFQLYLILHVSNLSQSLFRIVKPA